MPPQSQLAIKTSAVQRYIKEEASYHRETEQVKTKLEHLQSHPEADEYEVKQQKQVLEQTIAMAPAVRKRLREAVEALEIELENALSSESAESKETAKKAIEQAQALLAQYPNDGQQQQKQDVGKIEKKNEWIFEG